MKRVDRSSWIRALAWEFGFGYANANGELSLGIELKICVLLARD